jgi:hypothetical protein
MDLTDRERKIHAIDDLEKVKAQVRRLRYDIDMLHDIITANNPAVTQDHAERVIMHIQDLIAYVGSV